MFKMIEIPLYYLQISYNRSEDGQNDFYQGLLSHQNVRSAETSKQSLKKSDLRMPIKKKKITASLQFLDYVRKMTKKWAQDFKHRVL